jgi:serine/threonine protein phosphatase PrpC
MISSPKTSVTQNNNLGIKYIGHVYYDTMSRQVYEKNNEDALFVNVHKGIYAIADGMGGESSPLLSPAEMSVFILKHILKIPSNNTKLHDAVDFVIKYPKCTLAEFSKYFNAEVDGRNIWDWIILLDGIKDKENLAEIYRQRAGAVTIVAKEIEKNTFKISKSGDTVFFVIDKFKNVRQIHGLSENCSTDGYIASVANGKFYVEKPKIDKLIVKLEKNETLVLSSDFIETESAVQDFIDSNIGQNLDMLAFQKKHKLDDATFVCINHRN